jgi:hypothetical protein
MTKLQLRCFVEPVGEFAGYIINGPVIVPDIRRRVDKVRLMQQKDYAYFCEYRKSLLDYVETVRACGEAEVVFACAEATVADRARQGEVVGIQRALGAVWEAWEALKSYTHVDEEQWKRITFERDVIRRIPTVGAGKGPSIQE